MKIRLSVACCAAALATMLGATGGFGQSKQGESAFRAPITDKPADPIGPQLPQDAQTQRLMEEELDSQLVGAWALVTTADKQMTNPMVEDAVKRCLTPLRLQSLNIETGAARSLPKPEDLFGDIVYYRSLKGLQRLSLKTGQIIRLPKIVRQQLDNGNVVWGVAGRVATFRIRFANPSETRRVEFMLEEGGVYLKCQLKPALTDQ